MKHSICSLALLSILLTIPAASQPSITFDVAGIEAAPFGPWMFSTNSCANFSSFCGGYGVYAYRTIRWNPTGSGTNKSPDGSCCNGATGSGVTTTTSCTNEATNVLTSTSGVSLYFNSFTMSGFQSTGAPGSMGDRRVYSGAQGYISVSAVQKLKFTNSRITFDVPYPSPCGAGGSITGNGWATIDAGNSDPAWVAEFDPNSTGQVEIATSSFSPVVQQCYGTYSGTMMIKPCAHVENIVSGTLSSTGNPIDVTVDLSSADVSLRFTAAVVGKDESGNPDTTLNSAVANQILNPPSGSLPDGITTISRIYWQILTTLESYTADITFDLARVSGIVNPSNLRILKRLNSSDAWTIVSSYTLVDASHLKATGITSFSEWAIGSTADNPLPVTLQSFGASVSGRVVHLQWETASDMNFFGFDVEKKEMNGSGTGNWTVAGFVPGTGSSNAPTRYEFSDACRAPGTYTYRIKMIDKDGTFFYSSESEVHIELLPAAYLLKQNFPNPFNPATTIQFSVALDARATLKIFNTIGKEMTVLFNGAAQAGTVYSFVWNGRMFPSDTYFAVLETGAKKEMIKLSLVK